MSANDDLFLTRAEMGQLTGTPQKSRQVAWLRNAGGLAFRVSASGHPVVTRMAVLGRPDVPAAAAGWTPRLAGG